MTRRRATVMAIAALAILPAHAQTPPELYLKHCAVCHLPGIAGAPKVGDNEEWSRRTRPGINMVYRNALQGMPNTAMTAKGGQRDLGDDELKAIVDYMISAARLTPDTLRAAAHYDALVITNRDFIRLDANFDGYLSRDEVAADPVLAQNHERFDAEWGGIERRKTVWATLTGLGMVKSEPAST